MLASCEQVHWCGSEHHAYSNKQLNKNIYNSFIFILYALLFCLYICLWVSDLGIVDSC